MTPDRLQSYENDFTPRELAAYRSIQEFRAERNELLDRLKSAVERPFDRLADSIEGTNAGDLLNSAVNAVVERLSDASSWSIDREKVFDDFRDLGHDIDGVDDVRALELEIVESTVAGLGTKYSTAAFAQGAVTGVAGLAGAVADIPMILTAALRAINEYAIRYGYDVMRDNERHFAMMILAAAAARGSQERQKALDALSARAQLLRKGPPQAAEGADTPVVAEIGESVVLRLARGMLAESIPVLGAVVSGAMNISFMRQVCETAHHAYQERWLLDRYAN